MAKKANKIEPRTIRFNEEIQKLKNDGKFPGNDAMAVIIGAPGKGSISEIKSLRQNIQPEQWAKFKAHYKIKDNPNSSEIYVPRGTVNLPAQPTASPSFLDDYIEQVKARLEGLEADKRFFQRLVESSLVRLHDDNNRTLAEVQGGVRYRIELDTKGDPQKMKASLAKVSKYAGDSLHSLQEADRKAAEGM